MAKPPAPVVTDDVVTEVKQEAPVFPSAGKSTPVIEILADAIDKAETAGDAQAISIVHSLLENARWQIGRFLAQNPGDKPHHKALTDLIDRL